MQATQHELIAALDKHFTKVQLEGGLFPKVKDLLLAQEDISKAHGVSAELIELLNTKNYLNKGQMLLACAVVFASETLYNAFRKRLSYKVQEILQMLIWEIEIPIKTLEARLNYQVAAKKKSNFIYEGDLYMTLKEFRLFKSPANKYADPPTFSIPQTLAQHLRQWHPKPKGYYIEPVTQLPKTDYVYDQAEVWIMQEIPRTAHYLLNGKISRSKSGQIHASSSNKIRKALKLKEFFDPTYKEGVSIRTHLLLQLLSSVQNPSPTIDPITLIKQATNNFRDNLKFNPLSALTLHLSGTGHIDLFYQKKIGNAYWTLLNRLPQHEWVSMDNILAYCKYRAIELEAITAYQFSNFLHTKKKAPNGYSLKSPHPQEDYELVFYQPFVKALFFLMGTFGLVDLAYNQPLGEQYTDYQSVFDQLKYVRLNDLGAYLLGKTKEYTPKQNDSHAKLVLSDTSMSIYLTEEDEAKSIMLQPFAKKVSPQRFLMDYSTFLKDCKEPSQLKEKIAVFKTTFADKLPPNWQAFFEELVNKSDCFSTIEEHYTFHLKEDRELLLLLSRDQTLKQLVIRAEDYHIIVRKKHITKFRNKLKEYGYLI